MCEPTQEASSSGTDAFSRKIFVGGSFSFWRCAYIGLHPHILSCSCIFRKPTHKKIYIFALYWGGDAAYLYTLSKTDAIETHALIFGWQLALPNFMQTWRKLYPKEMEDGNRLVKTPFEEYLSWELSSSGGVLSGSLFDGLAGSLSKEGLAITGVFSPAGLGPFPDSSQPKVTTSKKKAEFYEKCFPGSLSYILGGGRGKFYCDANSCLLSE